MVPENNVFYPSVCRGLCITSIFHSTVFFWIKVEDSYGKKAKPKSLNLRITAKPYFTTPIHDTVVDFGATVSMTCEAAAIPSPQHQWFRNGVDLADLISRNVVDPVRYSISQSSDTRSTLTITNVSHSGSYIMGQWTCVGEAPLLLLFLNQNVSNEKA